MDYKVLSDKIEIIGKEDFNPKHILECGQIFRFKKDEDNNYIVFSAKYKAKIIETELGYDILTNEPNYFEKFFNLKVNYSQIKNEIIKASPIVNEAVSRAYGLRILKGDLFELIVSFIISANNNIKRIKLILDRLAMRAGKNMGDYYAFPTAEEFEGLTEEFFVEIGAGYRAKYLKDVKVAYEQLVKEDLSAMSVDALRERLMKIKGVGPKVADCILLFAFNKYDVFPVDVWMERVYYEFFSSTKRTRTQISKYLTNRFKNLAGYIQQYLFYFKTIKN